MNELLFLNLALLLNVKVTEELLHLFEIVIEQEYCLYATKELIEFHVLFFSFVQKS